MRSPMPARRLLFCGLLALVAGPCLVRAQHGVTREYAALAPTADARPLQPLLDEPLADPSLTIGPGGVFYLTGSVPGPQGSVFDARVRIWRSADRKAWTLVRTLDFSPARVRAPEIHFLKDAFWLTLAREGGGTDLVKFDTQDLAASPFQRRSITGQGADPSLFLDEDGTFYWVLGEGAVARMQADPLAGLAGEPKAVLPGDAADAGPHGRPRNRELERAGARGAFLARIHNRYALFFADTIQRQGFGRTGLTRGPVDTFVAYSDRPDAGYRAPSLAFPHAGQTTLCRDAEGAWWATFSGGDERAIFRDRAGAFRVEVVTPTPPVWTIGFALDRTERPEHVAPFGFMVRPDPAHLYEAGPVARLRPIPMDPVPGQRMAFPWIRDTCIIRGHDGAYYMTGTSGDMNGVHVWRSPDLKKWTYLAAAFEAGDDRTRWYNANPGRLIWAPEIHYLKGTYWISWCANGGLGIGLHRSVSGRAEGPYEPTVKENRPLTAPHIDASLFQDTDGAVYLVWQGRFLRKLNDTLSGFAGPQVELMTTKGEQVGYEGVFLRKIGDWYVVLAAEWNGGGNRAGGTYDLMYAVSKQLTGPYTPRRIAVPHAGHSTLFQDAAGRWYATLFGNDRTAPFRAQPGVIPLDLRDTGDDLHITPLAADPAPAPAAP